MFSAGREWVQWKQMGQGVFKVVRKGGGFNVPVFKSFQILNPKYEIDFLNILFTEIGSTKPSTDLVLTTGEKILEYIYLTYIQESLKL